MSTSDELREAALEYHRFPRAGKDQRHRHQAAGHPARSGAGLFAGRRRRLRGDRRRSRRGRRDHRARQPGGGDHQRHRGAGAGRHRPAGGQAGDGGQGRSCSRNSPASTSSTSRSTSAIRTSWSTIIAALEPTFGAINLEDIKAPECFDIERQLRERMNDPGVPRRPARHRDHRRRRGAQRR